jgi:enoyl-CoA hydratase/carnithine racemase
VIRLNRPKNLNALNSELMGELIQALKDGDKDKETRSFIVTGNEKVFAAGADIKEMKDLSY